ncbi:holo-ACP synthase [Alkalicoccus luteus]|uniref:Holo-[acyl-carrier-protein] synthase n=1 Tax=Alkalicoccus luteus TaxID=1237094 RepID=A0A969Q037_9BACI|nr:holo-ACP synthase [Alkalicoccus luteus]NJP38702.1 holo-[acyl-carrier-protein] synthase [Alkalicoccus luteus]
MITGTGIDLIELDRIEKSGTRLAVRILTKQEFVRYNELKGRRQVEYLAGRFAVKEAYAKAKGCGIGASLSFQDIETEYEAGGRPTLKAPGAEETVHVSISHSRMFACAHVVIEKGSSR